MKKYILLTIIVLSTVIVSCKSSKYPNGNYKTQLGKEKVLDRANS